MSRSEGIYYLARVSKVGRLNIEKAIVEPTVIHKYNFSWTIITGYKYKGKHDWFVYGKLCKFSPQGEIAKVDIKRAEEIKQIEPNLIIASSPFVYLPTYSGLAFMRVPSQIEPNTFMARFEELMKAKYDNFFVDCHVKPVADLRTFAVKLLELDGIYQISANVSPPNPLFGPLWKPLKDYMKKRRTNKFYIQEKSADEPLSTSLPEHVMQASKQEKNGEPYIPAEIDIGDSAILMAADGYGSGLVKGRKKNNFVLIRTSETIKNFSFDKDPDPYSLYERTLQIFRKIEEDRHLEHEE